MDLRPLLRHTWPIFLARHGRPTEVQARAIPPILHGANVLVEAATASGKTEAVVVPLVERYLAGKRASGLTILYLCPTRALVRDLYQRLAPSFEALRLSLAMKSGDTGPVSARRPPSFLITTPESTDALLCRAPRLFAPLRAVVIDEVHLFDEGARGDHLRCLLRRIEHIRHYAAQQAQATAPPLQRVALSATLPHPQAVATRYLGPEALHVGATATRPILADLLDVQALDDLAAAIGQRAVHKALLFCNTRHEVEQVAAYLRHHLPHEAAIFVHYSNLDPALRREVEQGFAAASVALCVSSSTLELGIDIGTVEEVVLFGPPPTLSAFLQRVGRGARRRQESPALCVSRTPLERLRFEALLDLVGAGPPDVPPEPPPRLAVLVQQSFSLLKQSPTGGLRLADLRRVASDEVDDESLRAILAQLARDGWLRPGRPGEWRPDRLLDELADRQEIYSTIEGETLNATMVDAFTGRPLARVARSRQAGERLMVGGRPQEVLWRDHRTFGVRRGQRELLDERLSSRRPPIAVPLEVAQAMVRHLGVPAGTMPRLLVEGETWLFHGWGDLYGEWLAALLAAHTPPEAAFLPEPINEIALRLSGEGAALPPWDAEAAMAALHRILPRVSRALPLGRFRERLPPALAAQNAVAHCYPARFQALYRAATITLPGAALRTRLLALMG